jgi:hypothetical protein
MSYTTMYTVDQKGDVCEGFVFSNSWRGAYAVWQCLIKKYGIFPNQTSRLRNPKNNILLLDTKAQERLWALRDDCAVEYRDRMVLATTLANVMVRRKNFRRLAKHLFAFDNEMRGTISYHSSLPEQASVLRCLRRERPSVVAVCWRQTSVCENPWRELIDPNDEDSETRPYNIHKDEPRHWWLFDVVKKRKGVF